MISRLLISLCILAFSNPREVSAREADSYFYGGARNYADGRLPEARRQIEAGLAEHPGDKRLAALLRKIEEESNKKKQDQQQDQQEDQKQEQDQDQQQGQDQQKDQKQQQDQEQQQGQEQQQDQEEQKDQEQQQDQKQQAAPNPQQNQEMQEGKPRDGLTQEEAERILEALRNRELKAQKHRRVRLSGRGYTGKEW